MNPQSHSSGPYQVMDHIIGQGAFGVVKLGLHRNSGKLVAVKTEPKDKNKSLLVHENNIIKSCQMAPLSIRGIMKSLYFWEDSDSYYLVLDLMGPSIDAMHKICSRSFSLKTTLMLGLQMISLVEFYHRNGVVHRDIKPANFLTNYSVPHTHISLVDFGLAKKYKVNGKQIPYTSGAAQVGSLRYMSKYVHQSIEPAPRDDLYSLGYCMIFMFTGVLPWQHESIMQMTKTDRKTHIGKLKSDTSNDDLVSNCVCRECSSQSCPFKQSMGDYFRYLDSLAYDTSIDYGLLINGIRECMRAHGYINDGKWDWNKYYII